MLSFAEFDSLVEPVLQAKGCDSVAGGDCHGGGIQGTFRLSPPGAKSSQYDFNQASLQVSVTSRPSSRILTKPLAIAAGGVPHNGGNTYFPSTADSSYQAILKWINDGVAQ
jgi:hypothetical protein